MKLLLTGATGAVGASILRYALADPSITNLTVLLRNPLPTYIDATLSPAARAKAAFLTHADFLAYSPETVPGLAELDGVLWAQGKTTRGMSEADYTRLTHDYPLAAARAVLDAKAKAGAAQTTRFVYVSGMGADPSGTSAMLFARVKGRTETDLTDLAKSSGGALQTHILRPAYFFPAPEDAPHARSSPERVIDKIVGPIFRTVLPNYQMAVQDLARFAVEAVKGMWPDETLFLNARMRALLKKSEQPKTRTEL